MANLEHSLLRRFCGSDLVGQYSGERFSQLDGLLGGSMFCNARAFWGRGARAGQDSFYTRLVALFAPGAVCRTAEHQAHSGGLGSVDRDVRRERLAGHILNSTIGCWNFSFPTSIRPRPILTMACAGFLHQSSPTWLIQFGVFIKCLSVSSI